jgi:DNA polymerase V
MNPLNFIQTYQRKPQHFIAQNVSEISIRTSYRSAFIPLYPHASHIKKSKIIEATLSADDYLVKNPTATYFVKVTGDAMEDAGIFDGDVLVVDRSIEPSIGQIVLAEVDGQYTVNYLEQQRLVFANRKYPAVTFDQAKSIALIGVVTGSMRKF